MSTSSSRQWKLVNSGDLIIIVIFLIAFFGGIINLKYGFSFIDEGMYLTDAWRLAAGDSFFPDSSRFSASLYSIFSSVFFMVDPELSVLGVRRIQFALSIIAMAAVVGSIIKYIPELARTATIISLPFVFLGLDPLGHTSSLSYTTVPNFFFIALFALYIIYYHTKSPEKSLYIALLISFCNAFLFFSYIPLGLTYASTILLFRLSQPRAWVLHTSLLAVGVLSFLTALQPDFLEWFDAVKDQLYVSRKTSQGVSPWAKQICLVSVTVSLISIWSIKKMQAEESKVTSTLSWLTPTVGLLFFIWGYASSFSGLLSPVYNGWFDTTGILVIANIVTVALGLHGISDGAGKLLQEKNKKQLLGLIGILYFMLFSLAFALTSSMGILEIGIGSFVLWTSFAIANFDRSKTDSVRKNFFFAAIFVPSAIALPVFDWSFTHFDDSPNRLDVRIETGPAKGLVTSQINHDVERAVRETILRYTNDDDFLLSWEQTPMPYFLSRRRPAIDHSWTGITSGDRRIDAKVLEKMISLGREPKMAIFWSNKLLVFPKVRGHEGWRSGSFPAPNTLITEYVRQNMKGVQIIQVDGENAVEFYLRKEEN